MNWCTSCLDRQHCYERGFCEATPAPPEQREDPDRADYTARRMPGSRVRVHLPGQEVWMTLNQAIELWFALGNAVLATFMGGARYRHKVRGTLYRLLHRRAFLQASGPIREGTQLVIYLGEDGSLWARPVAEFDDGRFEMVRD